MNVSTYEAARRYLAAGFSLIPCTINKRPALPHWQYYIDFRPTAEDLEYWFKPHGHSIGLIMGAVSNHHVAIDLDGSEPVRLFLDQFPDLADTFAVRTGSGVGAHFYYRVAQIPKNTNVRLKNIGGFEIRGNGQYVIAPPSYHPSGNQYTIERNVHPMAVHDLERVRDWMLSLKPPVQKQVTVDDGTRTCKVKATNKSEAAYLSAALRGEITKVESAFEGNRNNTLFYAALRLANYAASGALDWSIVEQRLTAAALSCGMNQQEAIRTIASAWNIGRRSPRSVPGR
jgi:hypothetical protein